MARDLDFQVFDSDNHFYETQDALTKFLPERYKKVIDYVDVHGRTKIVVRGQISDYIPNPTFDVVAAPGAQEDYYRHGNPDGKSYREIMGKPIKAVPAFREPGPRLEMLDELGIARSLMFPTLASLVEERMRDDPELIHTVIHALNQWIHETWSFDYEGRIFAVPVITLPIVDRAIEELDWVVERGAKVILIRPAPVPGFKGPRSFALPEFDPFWERVVEHDILVTLHGSDSGYSRYTNEWVGAGSEFLPFQPQTFQQLFTRRSIEDSVASLICHGALTRHPKLRVATIETGSNWVVPLFDSLRTVYKKFKGEFEMDPIEIFKRNISVNPFWEEDANALCDLIGEDHVLFGSDYPHPEGLADPVGYVSHLEGASSERIAKIMGGNIARLMKVDNTVAVG